jgi:hypothetical protein
VDIGKVLDYFPEIKEWVKRLSLRKRIFLLLVVFFVILAFPMMLKSDWRKAVSFIALRCEVALPFYVWALLLALLGYLIVDAIRRGRPRKKVYLEFIGLWWKYSELLSEFGDLLSIKDKNGNPKVEPTLLRHIFSIHETRDKIRVLLSKIGEKNLCHSPSDRDWARFLERNSVLKETGYATPFSFLTDFVNPEGFLTHYGEYWLEALSIADKHIESLRHHLLPKKRLFKDVERHIAQLQESMLTTPPRIDESSTALFTGRMAESFPGVRGLKWFDDPTEAVRRLLILLKPPLEFGVRGLAAETRGITDVPIWWWRGFSDLHILRFEALSRTKCLLDHKELEINRIAAYRGPSYYRDFVYVEARPEPQTGLYDVTEEEIREAKEKLGYAFEEYGLLGNTPITRQELDDGAAVVNNEVVDVRDGQLRVRFLTRYNFIISAQFSPYNSPEFQVLSEEYLNGILKGTHEFSVFLENILKLDKHPNDI